jgi:predicted O-linked N-acetylglucosamine transferase (SPINDLY family)
LAKLQPAVLDAWAGIMHRLPTSRLVIFRGTMTKAATESLHAQFAARGIARERIDCMCLSTQTHGYSGYMAKYGDVDICLDTFPGNAGTTACESLWMGVPWLTIYGDRFFGRMTASISSRLGLSDWVVRHPNELADRAEYWENHLVELASLRCESRSRFSASTVGNAELYARGLEVAYREMWVHWCTRNE